MPIPKPPSNFWNEAEIIGDLGTDEAQAVLESSLSVLMAPSHLTPGDQWERVTGTVFGLLDGVLTRHPVEVEKHGKAIAYALSDLTGKTSTAGGRKTTYAYRLKDRVLSKSTIEIDVDGTDKIERVAEALYDDGHFSVLYTSHSHHAKRTPEGDRFRIVAFLDAPVLFPNDPPTRAMAVATWEARYVGFAQSIGLTHIDKSGMILNQIQHPPRRPSKDAEFKHYVIAGRGLPYSELPECDVDIIKDATQSKRFDPHGTTGGGSEQRTPEKIALRRQTRHRDASPYPKPRGFDQWLWVIGDGEGRQGFDGPIYKVTVRSPCTAAHRE